VSFLICFIEHLWGLSIVEEISAEFYLDRERLEKGQGKMTVVYRYISISFSFIYFLHPHPPQLHLAPIVKYSFCKFIYRIKLLSHRSPDLDLLTEHRCVFLKKEEKELCITKTLIIPINLFSYTTALTMNNSRHSLPWVPSASYRSTSFSPDFFVMLLLPYINVHPSSQIFLFSCKCK